MRSVRFASALVVAIVGAGASAQAQLLDYGAAEQMFGEHVTMSATGSPLRQSDVPATMEIIGADDIRRSGARDIPGVLRHTVGIDVFEWANGREDVGVRGYVEAYAHRLLVLIDGRQVYADHYGYTPWSTLPVALDAIRQIEVVKGPACALFGFNAVDGVINIVTFNPQYDDVNAASVTGGTQDLVEGSLVTTAKLGAVAIRLSGSGRLSKDFNTPVPPAILGDIHKPADRGFIDLDTVTRLAEHVQLTLAANYSVADENEMLPSYLLNYARSTTKSVRGQLTADTSVGLLQASAYSNWINIDNPNVPLFGSFHFRNNLTTFEIQDLFKAGANHTFRISAEFRNTGQDTTTFTGGHVSYDIYAVGGMWNWAILPSLRFTNAVRMDYMQMKRVGPVPAGYPFTNADWNRSLTTFSFNSGLVWNVDQADAIRVTAARGIVMPSLAFSGGFVSPTPIGTFGGNPNLQPTAVTNLEGGWDHALSALNAHFEMVVFYQQSRDVVSLQGQVLFTPTGLLFSQDNVGDSNSAGVTVQLKGQILDAWQWELNGRYQSITDTFRPGIVYLDFAHAVSRYTLNARLGWSGGPWEIDGYIHYQTRTSGLQPTPTGGTMLVPVPDFAAVDGRIGYALTDAMTLAVSGQNLLTDSQRQTSSRPVERRVLGTISFRF